MNKKPYTQEQLEDFKLKYPKVVRELVVYPSGTNFDKEGNSDEEPAYFIIKKPSKSLVSLVNSKEYKGNDDKINDAIIKNCVLAGDMELLENDASIYTGVLDILANLLSASKAELKKSIESALLNEEEFDYFEGIDALIFYHFKKNPDLMDDEEYIQHYKAIDFQ